MTNDELASKMVARVEFMLLQFMPKPTCNTKMPAWHSNIRDIKQKISARLTPGDNGIKITVS